MPWVDDGRGGWRFEAGEEVGEVPPAPSTPPPSATPAEPPPPQPDGWPGWKWDAQRKTWRDDHDKAGHSQWLQTQQVQEALPEAAPTMADASALGFDPMARSRDPNLDQAALDPYRADRAAALGDQRNVLQFALGLEGPQQLSPAEREALEQRFAERALRTANSAAANARGGAGAVASQRLLVNQQMPTIAADANQQAQQAATQEFNSRVQAFQARVGQAQTAGGIANTIGQTATGAFGQEVQTQQAQAQIDLGVLGIDQTSQAQVSQMVQHLNQLGLDYSKLDVATQLAILDDLTTRYQVDKTTAAQIKAAAEANKMTPLKFVAGLAGIASDTVSAGKGVGLIK